MAGVDLGTSLMSLAGSQTPGQPAPQSVKPVSGLAGLGQAISSPGALAGLGQAMSSPGGLGQVMSSPGGLQSLAPLVNQFLQPIINAQQAI